MESLALRRVPFSRQGCIEFHDQFVRIEAPSFAQPLDVRFDAIRWVAITSLWAFPRFPVPQWCWFGFANLAVAFREPVAVRPSGSSIGLLWNRPVCGLALPVTRADMAVNEFEVHGVPYIADTE